MKIKKIISGGQSGADQGGILFALRHDIPCEINIFMGFRPVRGWIKELGPLFKTNFVVEKGHYIANLVARTKYNVENSDSTIIFTNKSIQHTKGSLLTLKHCTKKHKTCAIINLDNCTYSAMSATFWKKKDFIINIAGQRDLDEEEVCNALEKIFEDVI